MASATEPHRRQLDPSELGTKEYWDVVYDRELRNHENDADDEGTVWFSESNAEDAVVRQLNKLQEAGFLRRDGVSGDDSQPDNVTERAKHAASSQSSRFLDLGTGNGHMLYQLREEDDDGNVWSGEMIGVDYSEASIKLAQGIATQKYGNDTELPASLCFYCWDLLSSPPGDWLADGFHVVLDKGTFDAISLMDHEAASRHPCETYRHKVTPLLKAGGFLFITSCNWTKDELLDWLVTEEGELAFFDEAKYPTFIFGGRTGQSIVTIVLQRRRG
ncbi:Protein-lysine N-methyltransferase efm4 [Vermiconidia calcicola]|uniref:Protein-lysine N-methyltransferase efm4 n=1 Tax=Vermiconidia calcicola TaxID=1690605 RepID=A0ACC3MQS0_9PEZI|nr:Protein-lysine N-methyltransferase efm4 [Vermiconidia calcicola]